MGRLSLSSPISILYNFKIKVIQFQKNNEHQYLHKQYYFWQGNNANEVDLLEKRPQGFGVYEIKATQTITPSLFRQLDYFEALAKDQLVNKSLVYGGSEDQKRTRYDIRSWKNATVYIQNCT